jgi:hypothetical protein
MFSEHKKTNLNLQFFFNFSYIRLWVGVNIFFLDLYLLPPDPVGDVQETVNKKKDDYQR